MTRRFDEAASKILGDPDLYREMHDAAMDMLMYWMSGDETKKRRRELVARAINALPPTKAEQLTAKQIADLKDELLFHTED